MASPPPSSPPSASNSQNSATHPTPTPPLTSSKVEDGGAATQKGVADLPQENPDLAHFKILDSPEYLEKCRKYEADYASRLMAKYFSKKDFYGGNVYDEKVTIDDETIMASRWPCTQSFADPAKGFKEQGNGGSTSEN